MKALRQSLKVLKLKRAVCEGVLAGHPWVFRDKVGLEGADFYDGQWLQLTDTEGKPIATGIYQASGGVAVRVLRLGKQAVSLEWIQGRLNEAIALRLDLAKSTEAYRVVNGENDGFPGVVFDVYAGIGVLQTYFPGVDGLGRYLASLLRQRLNLKTVLWKMPAKRIGVKDLRNRVLYGSYPYVVRFHEGPLKLAVDLWQGQKSGTYLDLRGLRKFLSGLSLKGKRVLNLFSYTGALGLACAYAGAAEVVNVDEAQASLDFGKRYHKHEAMSWVQADIFKWISSAPKQGYDLIIVDPPSMASNKSQVERALRTYHHLYASVLPMLRAEGTIVACCCTSRISRRQMEEKISFALRPLSRQLSIAMELDHKATFPEADYLKVLVFKKRESVDRRPVSTATSPARARQPRLSGRPKGPR